jgi:hypothetical protein
MEKIMFRKSLNVKCQNVIIDAMIMLAIALPTSHAARGQPPFSREGMPGPWNNDVLAYWVSPGGEVTQTATFERAGVATIVRMKDERLIAAHQHFSEKDKANFDKVAVRFSSDEGKAWTEPQVIRLTGLPEGMRFPFDPTLVPLPDGRVRLYFTSLRGQRFEEGVLAIYSAISYNGVDYKFELGRRFGIKGRIVIDCAVVLHRGVFHLYAPDNGTQRRLHEHRRGDSADADLRLGVGYHAVSKDGLNFTRVEDVQIESHLHWLGGAYSDGKVITFIGTCDVDWLKNPGARPRRAGIWRAGSKDSRTWEILPAPAVLVADPGIVAARDGGWIVVGTGPQRRGVRPPHKDRSSGDRP